MARVATLDLRVRYAETDQMGVVYHTNYLIWCEMGRTDYIRGGGISYAEIERTGVTLAVAEASVRYLSPARYDDLIRMETTLASVRSRAVAFDYLVRHAETGARLASAHTLLVSIDGDGRPIALPPEIRSALERAMV